VIYNTIEWQCEGFFMTLLASMGPVIAEFNFWGSKGVNGKKKVWLDDIV